MEVLSGRPDITNLVESVAKEQGITNYTIADVQTNEKGEGYLGQILTIAIKDSASNKQLDLVIKAAFTDDVVRGFAPIENCFLNEIRFYTTIYPTFKNFERGCGVLNPIQLAPNCYKTIPETKKELICLENLKASNFEIFDKTLTFDDDHISLIFKRYGRFHAYSFALQDQKPEEYAEIISNLHHIQYEFLNIAQELFKELSKLVLTYLEPGQDDEIIEKFQKYVGDGIMTEATNHPITEKFDYSAILHGDCWSNNIMFKYEESEDGKKLVDMRLIDFQIIQMATPVYDLSYCLYSGASKAVFDNLDHFLKIYYESFSSFLRELGSDPEKLFPFDVLKKHWKKYSRYGMVMSLGILKMKATKKEDVVDFTGDVDENEILNQIAGVKFNEEDYKKKIRDLLCHMSEIDAL